MIPLAVFRHPAAGHGGNGSNHGGGSSDTDGDISDGKDDGSVRS